jgi:cold-inducible RNA-binding protein
MKNLFVGNLNFQTTESDLRTLFEPFGQVSRAHIATDRETGRSRGFAFVEMPNDEEAGRAMTSLDGKLVDGRSLTVNGGGGRGRGAYSREEFHDMPLGKREPRW